MTVVLPALAALTADGVLVANVRSRVLHVAVPGRRGLTPTGRLRRGTAPVCGQHARRWAAAPVDGRRLCRRCATRTPVAGLWQPEQRAALTLALAETLDTARDLDTISAVVLAMCAPGARLTGLHVVDPDGFRVRLTQLVSRARDRIAHRVVGPADHGWISSVKTAPPSRYPRRVS